MANLPNPAILSASGAYEIPTIPGRTYLLVLAGVLDGASLNLEYYRPASGDWKMATDGYLGTDDVDEFNGIAELRVTAPSNRFRIIVDDGTEDTRIDVIFQLLAE